MYENGFVLSRKPNKNKQILFDNILGISTQAIDERLFGLTIRKRFSIYLYLDEGYSIRIRHPNCCLPDLSKVLKEKIYLRIVPLIKEEFKSNKWVSFGQLIVNNKAIRIDQKVLPIESISKIQVESGWLVIAFHDQDIPGKNKIKQVKVLTSNIQNLEVFLQIIQLGGGS